MIENMNHEKFVVELKQLICHADWHRRFYSAQSRKYHRWDYWLKSLIGLVSLVGVALLGSNDWKWLGGIMAGGGAFLLANVIPNFKWDSIVAGLKEEQDEWTKIFHSYEDLLRVTEISEKSEILLQEFQRIRQMQEECALNDRNLPTNQKLLEKYNQEVNDYYKKLGWLE